MSRPKSARRIAPRLLLLTALPLLLIVIPAALLANLVAFFDDRPFFHKTTYLCVALFAIGASMATLVLPEILRVTKTKPLTLMTLVAAAVTTVGLMMAILVLLTVKFAMQAVIAVIMLGMGAVGVFYIFRNWTIWSAK